MKASRLKRDDRKVRGFESYPLRQRETREKVLPPPSRTPCGSEAGSAHIAGSTIRLDRGEVAERPKATAC